MFIQQIKSALLMASLAFGMLCLVPLSGFAEEPETKDEDWFHIEYILFEHLKSDRHVLRYEDLNYQVPELKQYTYLYNLGEPLTQYHLRPFKDEDALLRDAYQRLDKSTDTKVYAYQAWKQVIPQHDRSAPLKIQKGVMTGSRFELEGELQLKRNRYVHAEIDVLLSGFQTLPYDDLKTWFFEPEERRWPLTWLAQPLAYRSNVLEAVGNTQIPLNPIRFKQSRRIKDGEVHYIDHPAMGMIITVKQAQAPFSYGESSYNGFENGEIEGNGRR